LSDIEDFLEGRANPLDFSYDLPNLLLESSKIIDEFDSGLCNAIHYDLPEICSWYEEGCIYDPKSDVLDLPHFKIKVQHEKERILAYMKEKGIEV
jgi:hypothetical protein